MIRFAFLLLLCCFSMSIFGQHEKIYGLLKNGGIHQGGAIFSMNLDGSNRKIEYNFDWVDAATPWKNTLVEGDSGKLYGSTLEGGIYNGGTIYEYDYNSELFKIIYNFNEDSLIRHMPSGNLVFSHNKLYGITTGGYSEDGCIFEYDLKSGKTKSFGFINNKAGLAFTSGANLLKLSNGKIIGTFHDGNVYESCLFEIDFQDDTIKTIHKTFFSINIPIELANGNLLGIGKYSSDLIYEYNFTTDSMRVKPMPLSLFGANGVGSLVKSFNNKFYGITGVGGKNGLGTIFSYDLTTDSLHVVHDFYSYQGKYGSAILEANENILLGICNEGGSNNTGTLFEFNLQTNIYSKIADLYSEYTLGIPATGGTPTGGILKAKNGRYYFTNSEGGGQFLRPAKGTLMKLDTNLTSLNRKVTFNFSENGSVPINNLIQMENKLVSFTSSSGGHQFTFDLNTSNYEGSLSSSYGGSYPSTVKLNNGYLSGGSFYDISVMEFVYSFELFDSINNSLGRKFLPREFGGLVLGKLFQHSDGNFYGCSSQDSITIFKYDVAADTFGLVHTFSEDSTIGYRPLSYFLEASNGNLVGITTKGGLNGSGSIFQFDLKTNAISKEISNPPGIVEFRGITKNEDTKVLGAFYRNSLVFMYEYDLSNKSYLILDSIFSNFTPNQFFDPPVIGFDSNYYMTLENGGKYEQGSVLKYDKKMDSLYPIAEFDSSFIANKGYTPLGILMVIDSTTSILEYKGNRKKISTLYPNPSNGEFILRANQEQLGGIWLLFNSEGQLIEKGNINNTKSNINIKSRQSGIYFFQLNWENKREAHKLIVR